MVADGQCVLAETWAEEHCTVAVVLTTYNDFEFLADALTSVIAQERPADEIVVVDDGSVNSPDDVLSAFPQVKLIRKDNGGLASARNAGAAQARSRFISFLDADDRYRPNAISSGLRCFREHPEAVLVYGGHCRIRADGTRVGDDNFYPPGPDAYAALLKRNMIGMHAAVLYRRDALMEIGGFDETLRRCEDYDLYLRIARSHSVAAHEDIVAEYRWHGSNMSKDPEQMLETALAVHGRHRHQTGHRLEAWNEGRANWVRWYRQDQRVYWGTGKESGSFGSLLVKSMRDSSRQMLRKTPAPKLYRFAKRVMRRWPPPVGRVHFGSLGSTNPVSMDFGWDRGTPIDRAYIERFLVSHAGDICGRVFEVGDDGYSRRFGTGISTQDVLHLSSTDYKVTLVGDLTKPGVLPQEAFDCIILTQTLQLIFEIDQAVQRIHAALKPGGILLLTVPGISPIDRGEWGYTWYWSFTVASIRRLFAKRFDDVKLDVRAYGNVFAAIAFLTGVALVEIDQSKLEPLDSAYPVIVGLRAQK